MWSCGSLVCCPMWLENPLTGPLIMVTKLLRPMKSEMLVLEEVAEREVEVPT